VKLSSYLQNETYQLSPATEPMSQANGIKHKKDGYPTERVSVSAHFGLTGYAPGAIAVNVTWIKRGFNACQMHCNMYPSIFNRLRAIARYWSEIATFSHPLAFAWGCSHWNSGKKFGPQKTRIMGLPGNEDSLTIGWAVSTQYQLWWTDRQTSSLYQ